MSADKLKVAVVGVGYLGRFHALIFSRMAGVELVGVLDADAARAAEVAQEAGCQVFSTLDELPGQVDAASVVVPTQLHAEMTVPLLEAGIPVMLEKPIAPDLVAADRIISAAEQAGVVLQIGHLERFNSGVMALAERIHKPRFIEVHRMGAFVDRATDVDVVADLMIHDIDIVTALVPSAIRRIDAVGSPVITDEVDIANARLEFENGCVANLVASRVSEQRLRRIRVFEAQHYDSLDFIEQTIDTLRVGERAGDARWPDIDRQQLAIEPVKPLDAELEAFVNSVRSGAAPLVDGGTGRRALQVAIEVQQAMDKSNEVYHEHC